MIAWATIDKSADAICGNKLETRIRRDHTEFSIINNEDNHGKSHIWAILVNKYTHFSMPLTFLSEVVHPHENGDIPMEGIPSAIKKKKKPLLESYAIFPETQCRNSCQWKNRKNFHGQISRVMK